jgi:hypothetical protein
MKKLRKLSPMLENGNKLPSVGATRKKKNLSYVFSRGYAEPVTNYMELGTS